MLEVCEEVFVHNPWDVAALRDAAEAAEHLGITWLAQWLLESVQAQATEADFFRHLRRSRGGERRLAEGDPGLGAGQEARSDRRGGQPQDQLAVGQRHDPALRVSPTRSTSATSRRRRPPPRPPRPSSRRWRWQKLSPEERLQKEIQDHPDHVGPYLELAEIYKGRSQLEEAEKVLARGLKLHPKDEALLRLNYAEIQIAPAQERDRDPDQAEPARSRRTRRSRPSSTSTPPCSSNYELKEYQPPRQAPSRGS